MYTVSRSATATPAARQSSRIPPRCDGLAASSAACTRSARGDRFAHRRTMDAATFGHRRATALARRRLRPRQRARASGVACCDAALARVDRAFAQLSAVPRLRLHGDFHPGNIMWRDEGPHVVDLDDACNGPAVQDLWMLLSGDRNGDARTAGARARGLPCRSCDFDERELALIEPLRTLRMIHHSAWIAERWTDPAFPARLPVVRQRGLLVAAGHAVARAGRGDGRAARSAAVGLSRAVRRAHAVNSALRAAHARPGCRAGRPRPARPGRTACAPGRRSARRRARGA